MNNVERWRVKVEGTILRGLKDGATTNNIAECIVESILEEAISAVKNDMECKGKWISVDERLPEIEGDARTWGELKIRKSVRVLCACVQKSGKTFVKEGYCEVWGDSQRAYWKIPGSIDKVTHWMPLPEAPKMKGGAE